MHAAATERNKARRSWGVAHFSVALEDLVGKTAATRGFTRAQLLTNWLEIVGETIAAISTPLSIRYSGNANCGTLVVLTTGARGPELEMYSPDIINRVNSFHGYQAISKVRITQVARGSIIRQSPVDEPLAPIEPSLEVRKFVDAVVKDIDDEELRNGLSGLGYGLFCKRFTN